jgi:hypothetical protein
MLAIPVTMQAARQGNAGQGRQYNCVHAETLTKQNAITRNEAKTRPLKLLKYHN